MRKFTLTLIWLITIYYSPLTPPALNESLYFYRRSDSNPESETDGDEEEENEVQFLEQIICYKCGLCDSDSVSYDTVINDPLRFLEHMANHAQIRLPTPLSTNIASLK